MANDVATALSRLSGSLERGFGNIGRSRISRADYGLRRGRQELEAPILRRKGELLEREREQENRPGNVFSLLPYLKSSEAAPHMVKFLTDPGGKNFGKKTPLQNIAGLFGENAKINEQGQVIRGDDSIVPEWEMRGRAKDIGLIVASRSDPIKQKESERDVLTDRLENPKFANQAGAIKGEIDRINTILNTPSEVVKLRMQSVGGLTGALGWSDITDKHLSAQIKHQQGKIDKYEATQAATLKHTRAKEIAGIKKGKVFDTDKALKRISQIQKAKATLNKTSFIDRYLSTLPQFKGKEGQQIGEQEKKELYRAWDEEVANLRSQMGGTKTAPADTKDPLGIR